MTHHLKSRDIIALGFMTFALFVGAGNIIFPPMVGLQAGEHVWTAAFGFLITAVGLPVLTVIALAKVGGGVDSLSTPIGKVAGVLLATVCYLAVGPLFATPRTTRVRTFSSWKIPTIAAPRALACSISSTTAALFLASSEAVGSSRSKIG